MINTGKKKGFSLIELIVVFGIIGVLTSFSVAFYNNFKSKESMGSVVSALSSRLRLARERATLVQTPDGGCASLVSWWVRVDARIRTGYTCDGAEIYYFGDDFTIPTEVDVDLGGSGNFLIYFLPLTGTNSAAVDQTINISTGAVAGYTKQIVIEASGIINEI